tara:strand:- start:4745 stop:5095 length:351 start_codon:yes stop_codon:yes gene_type:complete
MSHFPTALFFAGLCLLWLSRKRDDPRLLSAASFNFSIGLLMTVLAALTGMVSADINLRTNAEIEGHQGYSMLSAILYGFCAGFSYTKPFSSFALGFYASNALVLGASVYTGYSLVF